MSTIKPRHAIAYHFLIESDTRDEIYGLIRQTYDGPLTLAEDMLVWNITKDDIEVRSLEPGRPQRASSSGPHRAGSGFEVVARRSLGHQ